MQKYVNHMNNCCNKLFTICDDIFVYILSEFVSAKDLKTFCMTTSKNKYHRKKLKILKTSKFCLQNSFPSVNLFKWLVKNQIRFSKLEFSVPVDLQQLNYTQINIKQIYDVSGNFGNTKTNMLHTISNCQNLTELHLIGDYSIDSIDEIKLAIDNILEKNKKLTVLSLDGQYLTLKCIDDVLNNNLTIVVKNKWNTHTIKKDFIEFDNYYGFDVFVRFIPIEIIENIRSLVINTTNYFEIIRKIIINAKKLEMLLIKSYDNLYSNDYTDQTCSDVMHTFDIFILLKNRKHFKQLSITLRDKELIWYNNIINTIGNLIEKIVIVNNIDGSNTYTLFNKC